MNVALYSPWLYLIGLILNANGLFIIIAYWRNTQKVTTKNVFQPLDRLVNKAWYRI